MPFAKYRIMILNNSQWIDLFSRLRNQIKRKLLIKTTHFSCPKRPKRSNSKKIWKFMSLRTLTTKNQLNTLPTAIWKCINLRISVNNQAHHKTRKISAYFIKSHCKSFAFMIYKKFVLNALFLDNIKDTTSRALNKSKKRNRFSSNKYKQSLV